MGAYSGSWGSQTLPVAEAVRILMQEVARAIAPLPELNWGCDGIGTSSYSNPTSPIFHLDLLSETPIY